MKKISKIFARVLSAALVVSLVLPGAPEVQARSQAESYGQEADIHDMLQNTDVQNNKLELKGESSVGSLLADTLSEKMEADADNASWENYITELEIEGTTATVSYQTSQEAEIVVAVYDESTGQMLGSGTQAVNTEETTAQVVITAENGMPDYFVAAAYLLDEKSRSSLCDMLETKLYTKEMQDLLDTTVNDYDAGDVLNLDENENTNFGVYSEDTVRVEAASKTNVVKENGDGTYTVTNADAAFTGLKKGDTFSYDYGDGNVLLVKVGSISVNGSTVVITEDTEADLTDFFDYLKIEADTDNADVSMEVDNSNLEDGVTYEEPEAGIAAMAIEGEGSYKCSHTWSINKKFGETITVKGSFTYGFKATVKYYVSLSYQYISAKIEYSTAVGMEISGKIPLKEIKLGRIQMSILPGVNIGFTPSFVVEASAKLAWEGEIKGTIGVEYDSDTGVRNLSKQPSTNSKFELSGKLFIGVKAEPSVNVISKELCELSIETEAGLEFSAKQKLWEAKDSESERHDCKDCYEGEIYRKLSVKVKLELAKGRKKEEVTLAEIKLKWTDFYWSVDYNEFAFTKCPHISYRVEIKVKDTEGKAVSGAAIEGTGKDESPVTDENGNAVCYLPDGKYKLSVKDGNMGAVKKIEVRGNGKKIEINLEEGETEENVVATGSCGEHLTYKIIVNGTDDNGEDTYTLKIEGYGDMEDYRGSSNASWYQYREKLTKLILSQDITSIGGGAFYGCSGLNGDLTIPSSVMSIGRDAFSDCSGFTGELTIPSSVTSIGDAAFHGCSGLSGDLTIPSSVTSIGGGAFYGCSGLSGDLTIPSSVTSIGDYAFAWCYGFTGELTIPSSVTRIEHHAFANCHSFAGELTIPSSVTSIGDHAFWNCSGFTGELTIPSSVTSIEGQAFWGCSGLSGDLAIPSSVTSIGDQAFWGCSGLGGDLTIPSSVTSIGDYAFEICSGLNNIYFEGNAPTLLGIQPFEGVTATAYYPSGNSTWTQEVMQQYGEAAYLTWVAHDYDTGQAVSDIPAGSIQRNEGAEVNVIIEEEKNTAGDSGTNTEDTPQATTSQTETDTALAGNVKLQADLLKMSDVQDEQRLEDMGSVETLPMKAFEGSVSTEGTQQQAAFTDLVPGEAYILLVVKDLNSVDLFADTNLLYIAQGNADDTGSLTFTYVPRTDDEAEVRAYGMPNQNLADAEITVDELVYTGELQTPEVRVTYKGTVLEEDTDYTLSGDTMVTEEGIYSITITGKNDYAGSVTKNFKVTGREEVKKGDINQDGTVNLFDLMECLNHVAKKTTLTGEKFLRADVDGNGTVNLLDLMRILNYVAKKTTTV